VVHLRPDVWLIADHVSTERAVEKTTTWTTSPDVALELDRVSGSYVLAAPRRPLRLWTFLFASPSTTIEQFEGSLSPFAGWHVADGIPTPAPAIVIEQPGEQSWSIVVWLLDGAQADSTRSLITPQVGSWQGPEEWRVEFGRGSDRRDVGREHHRITVRDAGSRPIETLELTPAPDVTDHIRRIQAAFAKAQGAYPRFYDLMPRRAKLTVLLLIVFLSQEVLFSFVTRRHPEYYQSLRLLTLVGWVAVGGWLVLWFSKTPY
jgi:hypothetical protein